MRRVFLLLGLLAVLWGLSGCSLNKMAVRMTANSLTSDAGSTVFTTDEDPELIADALPFGLKMYEALLAQLPEHEGLLMASAEGFVSYAHGFILGPAEQLPDAQRQQRKEMKLRAKNMFLRGRDYALELLEIRHPGFEEALRSGEFKKELLKAGEEDVEALYWAAAGWMGAVSAAGLDISMIIELSKPVALMARAFELDPDYGDGAIHSFLIQVYGAVPAPSMLYGTSETGKYTKETLEAYYRQRIGEVPKKPEKRALHHLERAVELSNGQMAGPYVSFASSFSVENQDADEYRRLLKKALAIDPAERPEGMLQNLLDQERAEWMLDHIGDEFLSY